MKIPIDIYTYIRKHIIKSKYEEKSMNNYLAVRIIYCFSLNQSHGNCSKRIEFFF